MSVLLILVSHRCGWTFCRWPLLNVAHLPVLEGDFYVLVYVDFLGSQIDDVLGWPEVADYLIGGLAKRNLGRRCGRRGRFGDRRGAGGCVEGIFFSLVGFCRLLVDLRGNVRIRRWRGHRKSRLHGRGLG